MRATGAGWPGRELVADAESCGGDVPAQSRSDQGPEWLELAEGRRPRAFWTLKGLSLPF